MPTENLAIYGFVKMVSGKIVGVISGVLLIAACTHPGEVLYEATKKCDTKAVKRLLSTEALAYRDKYGDSAAHWAAVCRKDFSALKAIVDYEPTMVYAENFRHGTPLFSAFGPNDYEKVLYLLEKGSDVLQYEQDQYGSYSLLERAVGNSAARTIRLLIERGADVTAASFYEALSSSDAEVLALLLPRLHPDIINRPDKLGRYPLEAAINRAKPGMLRFLLESGARTDVRFENGKTPLEHAEEKGGEDLVKIIRSFMSAPE